MKLRKKLYPQEAELLGLTPKPNETNRNQARYYITKEQWENIIEYRNTGVFDASQNHNVDRSNIKHLWLKDKGSSIFVTNPEYKKELEKTFDELETLAIKSIDQHLKDKVKPLKIDVKHKHIGLFDLAVYTDVHIGMNPNPNGFSLYGGKWDEKELMIRCKIFVEEIVKNQNSDTLYLVDLGDVVDGYDGKTVRQQHDLPQNMDNETMFDVAFKFKVLMIGELVKHYKKIYCYNVVDDNHSGSFGYIVNAAFKSYIELKYKSVKVYNQRRFITHFISNNKVFVITHGKDSKNLKFGFKVNLDAVQIEKIENYLFENDLINSKYDIYFMKGDSHQDIFDNSTSQKFKYWNFPAFSPSSNWIQTNYKKGVSGFYVINFNKHTYTLNPYYFKWKS